MSVVIKILFLFLKKVPNGFNSPIDFVFKQPGSQAGRRQYRGLWGGRVKPVRAATGRQ